jgi:hypothetical protein
MRESKLLLTLNDEEDLAGRNTLARQNLPACAGKQAISRQL